MYRCREKGCMRLERFKGQVVPVYKHDWIRRLHPGKLQKNIEVLYKCYMFFTLKI